ncbi:MAG TPA: outer membrane protein transport protein [Anaerolineae bacterium]|nr:outer membrane protein transport protein [Anaerolineae bacterium]
MTFLNLFLMVVHHFFTLLFTVGSVYAQEMVVGNEAGIGSRAMGMGGAYTAVADDFSALYYNPAGLSQIRRIEFNMGISIMRTREQAFLRSSIGTPSTGTDTGVTSENAISSCGGVLPIPTYRGSLVFAAGYNRVKEFNDALRVKGYSDSWDGIIQGESIDDGGLDMWSFAGAVDVSPNIALGGSLDFYRGDYVLDQKSAYYDRENTYAEFYSSGYHDKFKAWNLHLGMLIGTQSNFRIGTTLKLPIKYKIKDSYYDNWYNRSGSPFSLWEHVSPAYADSSNEVSGKFKYFMKSPIELNAGVSWEKKGMTFSADIHFLDWSQSETDLEDPEYFYRNSVYWRVGAETPVPFLNIFIRAGYASVPDPYKGYIFKGDRERTIIKTENKKDYMTFGSGILLDQSVLLDIAFIHGFWSSEDNPLTNESTRNKIFITLSNRI